MKLEQRWSSWSWQGLEKRRTASERAVMLLLQAHLPRGYILIRVPLLAL